MVAQFMRNFLRTEAASGIILLVVLVLVLIIANTHFFPLYESIQQIPINLTIGSLDIHKPLILWVNDGLMAIFFMLLALEIKRELLIGELNEISKVVLPVLAATGGVLVPIGIFFMVIGKHSTLTPGWAIPTTTDIALVIGLIALLGKRIPLTLKIFLLTIAIVDDVVAVILIAVFYSNTIALLPLAIAGIGTLFLAFLSYRRVASLAVYMLIGIIIWVATLKSGVHATIAGIAIGLCIPLESRKDANFCPLKTLEHNLHPWVAFLIMPVFVFMNAGIPFAGGASDNGAQRLAWAIALGLFFGKQIGIFLFSWIAIKLRLAKLPDAINWGQIYGVSIISGVGFTMSIFISGLAFQASSLDVIARQGILLGSFISAVAGMGVLFLSSRK